MASFKELIDSPGREHHCTICHKKFSSHSEKCVHGCFHWPPLCCQGCLCESFEKAIHKTFPFLDQD
jgi:hypothetical protein